jgi:predicted peptidase
MPPTFPVNFFQLSSTRVLVAAVALAGLAGMALSHAAETKTVHRFDYTLSKTAAYNYRLSLPTGYEDSGERRWPLLLFLHGAGERGDDVSLVATHGPPKLLRAAGDDPATQQLARNFVVVSPQCPKDKWWDTDALLALVDAMIGAHKIDTARVYVTGLSMGGFGTWDLAMAHPERFAAVAPICGGGQFASAYLSSHNKRNDLRSLAVWAFHGALDKAVPPAESERMMGLLKRFEVTDTKLTIYPDATHDSWTATYANPELYAWFLRHKRAAASATK